MALRRTRTADVFIIDLFCAAKRNILRVDIRQNLPGRATNASRLVPPRFFRASRPPPPALSRLCAAPGSTIARTHTDAVV